MNVPDAVSAAALWARRFLLRPATFRRLVTTTQAEIHEFTRVRWRGRRRAVVARTAPTESRSRKLAEPLHPASFDPWSDDVATLPARTLQLVECPTCDGGKRITCPDCRGAATVPCASCRATGRVYSTRSRRNVNCRSCRGLGARRCPCRDGLVRCPACAGRGKVDRWLEVVEERFDEVTHTPLDLLARALSDPTEPTSFDGPATVHSLAPEELWSGTPADSPPPQHAGLVSGASPLALRLDPVHDRLDGLTVQTFRGIASSISYRLLGATGTIHVQHWNGRLSETPTSRRPFHRRLVFLAAIASSALVAGLALALQYAGRHPYFAGNGNTAILTGLAFGLAAAALWPASQLALPLRAWRPRRLLVSVLPLVAVLAAQVGAAGTGQPSLARARQLAAAGDISAALREAAATADLALDPGAASFHDQLLLEQALAASDPAAAWDASRASFFTDPTREAAEAHALRLTIARAAELQARGDHPVSRTILALVPKPHADADELRPLRLATHLEHVDRCAAVRDVMCVQNELRLARRDRFDEDELAAIYEKAVAATSEDLRAAWTTIRSRRPLSDRLAACQALEPPTRFLDAAGVPAAFQPIDRDQALDLCHQLEQRRAREEAERRKARQRAWARAPLLCNDGTLSPTCTCGRSSRRGCCSWHGGVAGCSASYPG